MHIKKLATQVKELKQKWKTATSMPSKHKRNYEEANARLSKFIDGAELDQLKVLKQEFLR